jgi:hypothetical protein
MVATVARIRRCNRPEVYAVAQNLSLLAARPDAKPQGEDSFTIDSFFDDVGDAQAMLNEKFAILSTLRNPEAAETDTPLGIGTSIPIAPLLPKALMIDIPRGVNSLKTIKGMAVDTHSERNSIEALG